MFEPDNNTIKNIIAENTRRIAAAKSTVIYNPATGEGCHGNRSAFTPSLERKKPALPPVEDDTEPKQKTKHNYPKNRAKPLRETGETEYLPLEMTSDHRFRADMSRRERNMLRMKYDFEFWCFCCITIKSKIPGEGTVPFVLNRAQRRVLAVLEKQRSEGRPMRVIILKARQWGASTLASAYLAWMQLMVTMRHNAVVCAQSKETANVLMQMYRNIIDNYPLEYWDGTTDRPALKSVGGSRNTFTVEGRNSTYMICSAATPNIARGADISMAHLSETAFYPNSFRINAEQVVASICSSVMPLPNTLVICESTAKSVGNYFHTEWVKATKGESDKLPIFVPWHEIEIYHTEVPCYESFVRSMDEYEFSLFKQGITLEQIAWHRAKRREYHSLTDMMAEYPSTPEEAFASSRNALFDHDEVERLRSSCCDPIARGELVGDALCGGAALRNIRFSESAKGNLAVWEFPEEHDINFKRRYVVAVDIGGRSESSDFSVIAVFDRKDEDMPKLVAQWRGHADHDILAWKAARIARWYDDAVLIIESNTLDTRCCEGDHGEFILAEIAHSYKRIYRRSDGNYGFHTNRASKTRILDSLIAMVRDNSFIERDAEAVNEMLTYERKPDGSFGAMEGLHDDILMTRAIALSYCRDLALRHKGAPSTIHPQSSLLL